MAALFPLPGQILHLPKTRLPKQFKEDQNNSRYSVMRCVTTQDTIQDATARMTAHTTAMRHKL